MKVLLPRWKVIRAYRREIKNGREIACVGDALPVQQEGKDEKTNGGYVSSKLLIELRMVNSERHTRAKSRVCRRGELR